MAEKKSRQPSPEKGDFREVPRERSEGSGAEDRRPERGVVLRESPGTLEETKKKKDGGLELRAPSPAAGIRRVSEDRKSPLRKVTLKEKLKGQGRST